MGYQAAMEAAGAVVHEFEQFGSYQGAWWAKVTYNGETGWVSGYYGSCSGCDAFQGEFGFISDRCNEHEWDDEQNEECEECKKSALEYNQRLATFGKEYLDQIIDSEQAITEAKRNIEWDLEAVNMVKWLEEHK